MQGRDSADNHRAEGGEIFKFTVQLTRAMDNASEFWHLKPPEVDPSLLGEHAVSRYRPYDVQCAGFRREKCEQGKFARDVGDGTYEFAPFVTTQLDDSETIPAGWESTFGDGYHLGDNERVYLWGNYTIEVEAIDNNDGPTKGLYVPILDSPLHGTIVPIDCTLGGILEGSVTNEDEDLCQCLPGFEASKDQSSVILTAEEPVHIHCVHCLRGHFKELGGRDVEEEEDCLKCAYTTHTLETGADHIDLCICEPGFYDYKSWDLACREEDYAPPYTLYRAVDQQLDYGAAEFAASFGDECWPCDERCFTCFGNKSIAVKPGWWGYPRDRRMNQLPDKVLGEDHPGPKEAGGWYWTTSSDPRVGTTRRPLTVYHCKGMAKETGACIGGIDDDPSVEHGRYFMENGAVIIQDGGWYGGNTWGGEAACKAGSMAATCGGCQPYWLKGDNGCEPCSEDQGIKVDIELFLLAAILFGFAAKAFMKLLEKATAQDLLLGKILLAFAQVVQSFALTYSVTWPPDLLAFLTKLQIVNFDIFEIGNLECLLPGLKNFYTKFLCTVFIPVGLSVLVFLKFLHHRRKLKRSRFKFHIAASLLEEKIEAIEISGGYASKFFFVLIVTYLKTSATVLEMFKCRQFEPIPWAWVDDSDSMNDYAEGYLEGRSAGGVDENGDWIYLDPPFGDDLAAPWTNRKFIESDLRLSCTDLRYGFFFWFAIVGVIVYPVGVPSIFFGLMFRERDQIHDAINKMKYGFLFGDYQPSFFMWEIFDLVRKLVLSGLMIFFNRGSVTQVVMAMLLSLFFLQAQVRLAPYAFAVANTTQLISFNSIFFTLFGALLLKVDMEKGKDTDIDKWFCDNFVLFACMAVPAFASAAVVVRVGFEIYLTSTGQYTKRLVGSTSRMAFNAMVAKHFNKYYSSRKSEKKQSKFGIGGLKKMIKSYLFEYCWKTEDIDQILLADEMLMVQQRKAMKDRAEIYLMAAKVNLAEKREW
eukprot:SAG11_NODE_209_length_12331_cov_3.126226_3_plen_980_part_00